MATDNISNLLDHLVEVAKQATEPFIPQWEGRKDIAKTIISLASASLVFTTTFSSSLVKPGTPTGWRYAIIVWWAAFVCSLALSLIFLWVSIGLADLPAIILASTEKLKQAAAERIPGTPIDEDPIYREFNAGFRQIVRRDKRARILFGALLCFFGIALLVLTILGIRQLAVI